MPKPQQQTSQPCVPQQSFQVVARNCCHTGMFGQELALFQHAKSEEMFAGVQAGRIGGASGGKQNFLVY
uniref:Uncharacterized protein n=1 Tax=Nelumbo nucifera TaxID=4432 RepID=A0A822XN09_NELNU|nr:TPA_asm: hypothetical protein HUJ06_021809 [Nelumbo nucifera]